ncbi:cytochrome b6-f complex iron-sulfur subunit [Anthocerotibacter panamensis]|uniref:cytochrome b6-f complex iron-sulfur subunit n=1 Tax=Anthocerotibacter panamensis TaxID=2857077 RepID=UPI001C4041E6|nr:cytochrome b6-f complex iron-sulfur subunit [Anthocerotibacter panamensis]
MTEVLEPIPNGRRNFLTLLTTGAITGATLGALYPVVNYFIPPNKGGGSGGVFARSRDGKEILASKLLADEPAGTRVISQGLTVNSGTATYIVIDDDKKIANFGLNAVCPHLGCVVPWDGGIGKFKCPCHGSTYDKDGGLVRGPSPRPLALTKAAVKDDKIEFSPWTEKDFRKTDLYSDPNPWWT